MSNSKPRVISPDNPDFRGRLKSIVGSSYIAGLQTKKKAKKSRERVKVPFVDWYLIRGSILRKWDLSKIIQAKRLNRLLSKMGDLSKKLRRYE